MADPKPPRDDRLPVVKPKQPHSDVADMTPGAFLREGER